MDLQYGPRARYVPEGQRSPVPRPDPMDLFHIPPLPEPELPISDLLQTAEALELFMDESVVEKEQNERLDAWFKYVSQSKFVNALSMISLTYV